MGRILGLPSKSCWCARSNNDLFCMLLHCLQGKRYVAIFNRFVLIPCSADNVQCKHFLWSTGYVETHYYDGVSRHVCHLYMASLSLNWNVHSPWRDPPTYAIPDSIKRGLARVKAWEWLVYSWCLTIWKLPMSQAGWSIISSILEYYWPSTRTRQLRSSHRIDLIPTFHCQVHHFRTSSADIYTKQVLLLMDNYNST